ncbi:MAG TPA: lytic transglycosylase domain-containing protein, partial [Solirubrobacterales bacterium]|nr:lytic transglycosylase domain-containing protein [Solirubrobacterales bacterium]
MRSKIALIVVLASFLAVASMGAAMAGADPVGDSTSLTPEPTAPAIPSLQATACANGVDDDSDGLIDLADPDCTAPEVDSEEPPVTSGPVAPSAAAAEAGTTGVTGPTGSDGVSQGDAIVSPGGGVNRNDNLGESSGGNGHDGGVSAPSATGGGDQPLAGSNDGGSPFAAGGTPTSANPSMTIAPFGPAPIGVPNFIIDSFEIPPFLLPIYQACGTEYGIPWEVLASINKIETAFGTNLNVSSAGAVGWMQFLPSSWEMYGLDANGDGRKDPYNPVD